MGEQSVPNLITVAIPRPIDHLFTYRAPEGISDQILEHGWVKVPFGGGRTHAYVVQSTHPFKTLPEGVKLETLRDVLEAGDASGVIPHDVWDLCQWAADYYESPLGEVLLCAAPPAALGLKTKSARAKRRALEPPRRGGALKLTESQIQAIERLDGVRTSCEFGKRGATAVLNGVTGSGKTEVYIELALRTLAQGRGVLLLVPEIALTSQLKQRMEEGLQESVGLWHHVVPDGRRREDWLALQQGELRVLVGARSAIFAPIKNLGLIIVDEEHDSTFKQDERVRYNARDLAVVRGQKTGALVVLGSATPSLESRERVREGRYLVAELPHRATEGGMPVLERVHLGEEPRVTGIQAPFALKTLQAIQSTLQVGDQVMIYLNRRGFAAFLVCEDCGESVGCPECSISLTVHLSDQRLRCHTCGYERVIPSSCAQCAGTLLKPVGAGTESLETELPRFIPEMRALRLDRDKITSTDRLEQVLEEFRSGKANVLLGTQMLVKGHDFPGVTLVVVVLADALFRWPDFRAPERAYQVLTQVAGRAGRRDRPGRVMIQTFCPTHPVLQAVCGDIPEEEFLNGERELRRTLGYPPFGRLARVRVEASVQKKAMRSALDLSNRVKASSEIEVLGPADAVVSRVRGVYRVDFLLRASEVGALHSALKQVRAARGEIKDRQISVSIDVDPIGVG